MIDPTYYTPGMAIGRRKNGARTPGLWIATNELPRTGGHPLYQRLNQILETHAFDEFVEAQCAAVRSIVRRDSGESYQESLPRLDRTRPPKGRNTDWQHPPDPDARITKMKSGRTHLRHQAEHAVDLETGILVGVTVQGADQGDTTTIMETLMTAADAVARVTDDHTGVINAVVADTGTTVIRYSRIWRPSTGGATSRNRIAPDATGRRRSWPAPRSMRIADASALARAAGPCCAAS